MTKRFVLVQCHWDASGVIQTFGPFESEEAAEAAKAELIEIVNPVKSDKWEIVRCTDLQAAL